MHVVEHQRFQHFIIEWTGGGMCKNYSFIGNIKVNMALGAYPSRLGNW